MRMLVAIAFGGVLAATLAARQADGPSANPISLVIRNSWDLAKLNMRESAEQMPDDKYAYKPNDSVKTFGAIIAHVAGASYDYCARAKGEAPPFDEDHFEQTAKTKQDIQKALSDAFAYCDTVYSTLTDQTVAAMVSRPGASRQVPRASPLINNITHTDEHYGNLVTYFRLNGMVPPSTARETRK